MTRDQAGILTNIVRDPEVTVKSIEYPSNPGVGPFGDDCLKIVYTVKVHNVNRTWVDWYAPDDGVIASTRELVEYYNAPDREEHA